MDACALSRQESSTLAAHEKVIERGLSTFREVGAALLAIRDGKLYRAEHKTFEAYCQERWGWTRQRANYLIEATHTAEVIDNNCCQTKPANEAQARPLSAVPKESRAEVWEQVIEQAPKVDGKPKITAKLVQEVVDDWTDEVEEVDPEEMFDYLDQPVPEHAHAAFHAEHLIDDAIGQLKAAAKAGETVAESAAGKFLNLKQYRALLRDAKSLLEATRPFAVCPYCEGRKCSACAQVGVVPKDVHQQAE